jgi:isovaleryl-CoA dehydrogenase
MPTFDEIRERYRQIGAAHREAMREAWLERRFGWPLWQAIVDEGFLQLVDDAPERSLGNLAAALEGLSAGSREAGFLIVPITHCALGMGIIHEHASEPLRSELLARFSRGNEILCFAITEPCGGTDAFRPVSTLRRNGEGWLIDGSKWHITSAPLASAAIVWVADPECKDIAGVLVETGWEGVDASPPLHPAGAHSGPVGSLTFTSVSVPESHILVRGRGRAVLNRALVRERVLAGFVALGGIQAVFDHALEFSVSRHVSGVPIASHQHIQRRLCDIKLRLDTVGALAHRALDRAAAGQRYVLEASQLKMYATRSAMDAVTDAIQVCGSYGLQDEAQLYHGLLDGLCGTIAGGTEEAHRLVIMRELVRQLVRGRSKGPAPIAEQSSPVTATSS